MKEFYELFLKKQVPLWITLAIGLPLFLVKLTPLFDFLYKVYRDYKGTKEKHFKEAQEKVGNLEIKLANLIQSANECKNNKTMENILSFCKMFDNFFNDVNIICEGMNKGYIMKNNVYIGVIYAVLKHKYDKEDNMITDCYNILQEANRKFGINMDKLRMERYKQIFISYKKTLSFPRRMVGIFCNKVLEIK